MKTGLRAIPVLRWVATWPARLATLVLLGASLLSLIGTVLLGHDPGFLIGLLLIVGSVVAAIGMQRGVYRLIPLPALCYLLATTIAGYMHDRSVLHGGKEWVTNFLTWIGSAFFALVWATALIVVIAIVRGVIAWRLASMRPPAAAGASAGLTASGSARPGSWSGGNPQGGRDPQAKRGPRGTDRDAFADRAPGGSAHGGNESDPWDDRSRREDRTPREDRAPRGDRNPRSREERGPRPSFNARDERGPRDERNQDPYPDDPRDSRRPRPREAPRDLW